MDQWECRDPKMEARTFHMFGHGNSGDIPWNLALKNGPYIYIPDTSNLGWLMLRSLLKNGILTTKIWE
jgi:hypothetical protein